MHLDNVNIREVADVGYGERVLTARRRDSHGLVRRCFRRCWCLFLGLARTLLLLRTGGLDGHLADHVAAVDPVAGGDGERFDNAVVRRRHVHRRLVGLERDQPVFARDTITRADKHFDDLDVREIAQVRYDNIDAVCHSSLPPPTASPDPAGPDRCRIS